MNYRIVDESKFTQLINNGAELKTVPLITVLLFFTLPATIIDSGMGVKKEKLSHHWNL